MKAKTFEERLAAGLLAMGFTESVCKARYRKFEKAGFRNYFVGSKGALRAGTSVSNSWSMGDPANQTGTFKKVLQEGDKALIKWAEAEKAWEQPKEPANP